VEEFAEPLDLLTDPIWTYSDGGLPEGSVRFIKDGVKFQDGKMILEASYAPSSQECSHAENGNVNGFDLTSGEMRSRYNTFRYGRYEVRLKAPSPNATDPSIDGNYISTLFTFRTPKFEDWREIDIEVTGDSTNTVTTNVIYGDDQFAWSPDIADDAANVFPAIDTRTEFHDFAFEWLPDSIVWYLDGVEFRRYEQPAKRPIPNLAAKVMMNLWIFGPSAGFGGPDIENNMYPMHSEYERFRFYKLDG
jgi:beta-glucanase (GH16 family)